MSEGASVAVYEVWSDLATTMRMMRTGAGVSLRRAELESGVGRGTLSQVETAKARPNRGIVEWYDATFAGDGLLVSLYAEARGAHGREHSTRQVERHDTPGDAVQLSSSTLPHGVLVEPGARLAAGWTLRNTGTVPWHGRRLGRVGPHTAARLLTSDRWTPLPDCEPGQYVDVQVPFVVPSAAGTYAAYWHMTDAQGRMTAALPAPLSIVVVGEHPS